jgi:hypothetical protein
VGVRGYYFKEEMVVGGRVGEVGEEMKLTLRGGRRKVKKEDRRGKKKNDSSWGNEADSASIGSTTCNSI